LDSLLYLDTLLALVLLVGCGLTTYLFYINRKERALNQYVAKELGEIMLETQSAIQKRNSIKPTGGLQDLGDPEVLGTLVTVLVHKLGDIRLNVVDFASVANEEYVSVYVDLDTNDIVLSLNHDLTAKDSEVTRDFSYTKPDDETYH